MKILRLTRFLPKKRHGKTFRRLSSSSVTVKEKEYTKDTRLEGAYDPINVETKERYEGWCERGRFSETDCSGKHRGLVLPPPNITGNLHLGHALSGTVQDVIVRSWRMRGDRVSWLPGMDHAGIATQTRVEQYLQRRGLLRSDMDRETFDSHLMEWKNQYQTNIRSQLKRMGFSLDWKKETFTLNPEQSEAVNEAFVKLFDEGLIYRGNYLVNWSCFLKSAISDMEIDNIEINQSTNITVPGYESAVKFGQMFYFAYKIDSSMDEEIVVATTRPETILGDVAIAVNPNDSRYSHLIGENAHHPFFNRKIPIIADDSVSVEFGTGAVKITPAHDRFDCEVASKHELPSETVIDESGLIINSERFNGLKRYDARNVVLNELSDKGLLRDVREHKMILPMCSRSKDVIELLPIPQWYLNCRELGKRALSVVENGTLELIPKSHEKTWIDWIAQEKDWCLSRQLWWGHRIPVYKVYEIKNPDDYVYIAARSQEEANTKVLELEKFDKNSQLIFERDTDVLDTWFSSGIYPFSILGWPIATDDYKKLYPYELLITGNDILRFWVYRMVMLGLKLTDRLPFSKVLLHGIICDSKGMKMSKSKGNVIDPEDIINGITLTDLQTKTKNLYEQKLLTKREYQTVLENQKKIFPNGIPRCGADALRFTLCSKNITSVYVQFDLQDCIVNKYFGNKIWQSLKYYQNLHEACSLKRNPESFKTDKLQLIDYWILSRLNKLVSTVNDSIDNYELHIATNALKTFLYYDLCDVYVECTKLYLQSDLDIPENQNALLTHCHTFSVCYNTSLRCLSPFMPFLTEELIPAIPLKNNLIYNFDDCIDNLKLPNKNIFSKYENQELEKQITIMSDLLSTIRRLKNIYEIKKDLLGISIENSEINLENTLSNFGHLLKYLARLKQDIHTENKSSNEKITGITSNNGYRINLILPENYDISNAIRIGKEKIKNKLNKLQDEYDTYNKRINKPGYDKNTPDDIKLANSSKMRSLQEELEVIKRM